MLYVVVVQKLSLIQEKLMLVKDKMPKEIWEQNFGICIKSSNLLSTGSLQQLDNLLSSISDTVSRLSSIDAATSVKPLAPDARLPTRFQVVCLNHIVFNKPDR